MQQRMVRSACGKPRATRQLPRQSGVSPLSLCSILHRRNPRGQRRSATAANASLLQELRMGRSPHRRGIRRSRAGSVGRSVTCVRIAHPATETLVVALVLLAVSRIERFDLSWVPPQRARRCFVDSPNPWREFGASLAPCFVRFDRTPRYAGRPSPPSATRSDQTSPVSPRQRRTVPCSPQPAARPWRTSPPTCPAVS